MPLIRRDCPECKSIELRPQDITLLRIEAEVGDFNLHNRFRCVVCRMIVLAPVDVQEADIMENAGVKFAPPVERPTNELTDPVRRNQEPLTDYALDFHHFLEANNFLTDFVEDP